MRGPCAAGRPPWFWGAIFRIERGELTAAVKVRRTQVLENFKERIAGLYAGRE
ncbi:MAG: hypothetical protein ACLQU1_31370 [Bryobacteraceae bacterium]